MLSIHSSVSICNSNTCNTIDIGTNADADTITIGDNNDIFSINSSAFDVTTTGEVSGVTTMASSGNWDWSAATAPTITIKADDTFTISDVGGAFNFSVDTGPSYTGDARPTKKITLIKLLYLPWPMLTAHTSMAHRECPRQLLPTITDYPFA